MLKILFDRNSISVRFMELVGFLGTLWILRRDFPNRDLRLELYLFLLVCYTFLRFCDLIHWYPQERRGVGIEVHFRKALVPTSYILAATSVVVFLDVPVFSTFLVGLADLLMLVIVPVNGIVLYFHFKDKDPMPINYFTLNKHLHDIPTSAS